MTNEITLQSEPLEDQKIVMNWNPLQKTTEQSTTTAEGGDLQLDNAEFMLNFYKLIYNGLGALTSRKWTAVEAECSLKIYTFSVQRTAREFHT